MKVTFNLTQVQAQTARAITVRNTIFAADPTNGIDPQTDHFAGNLGGWMYAHQSFNTDQCLELDDSFVTYTGQRCPMQRDGSVTILLEIAEYASWHEAVQDGWSRLRVLHYHTSDPAMKWWETREDTIRRLERERGLTNDELIHALTKGGSGEFYAAVCVLKDRMGTPAPVPGTPEYRRAAAEGTLPTKSQHQARAMLKKYAEAYFEGWAVA